MTTLCSIDLPSGAVLEFSGAALVMAVINCTADSFYPESRAPDVREAVERALRAEDDGAAVIDIGAESSRPGARYIDEDEEKRRLLPVIEQFRKRSKCAVSIDTRKYEVARLALEAGADIINDISALEDSPEIAALCARHNAGLILMHKKGIPCDMQDRPYYDDVVAEVSAYLKAAALRAEAAGVSAHRIILDPGIGFGKRTEDNLDLIAHFEEISAMGYPALMALSRKSFLGALTGREVDQRLAGTIAANAFSLEKGACFIRVHDVREAVDLVKLHAALRSRLKNAA
ncbi:MAG: dihydropteroate synthase [Spirochaetaceae bacterium]|jgi:dihydropteroate synthase|nr:dihydropteroate synthase [Spirochaetaceae bacterium]